MRKITIRDFNGIAPISGKNMPIDYRTGRASAQIAESTDITSGKLKGELAHQDLEPNATRHNSLVRFDGNYYTGQDKHYLSFITSGTPILYYMDQGVLKKRIGNDIADVGQEKPGDIILAEVPQVTNPGFNLNDHPSYVITFVRNVGNFLFPRTDTASDEEDWQLEPAGKASYRSNVDSEPFPPTSGEVIVTNSTTFSIIDNGWANSTIRADYSGSGGWVTYEGVTRVPFNSDPSYYERLNDGKDPAAPVVGFGSNAQLYGFSETRYLTLGFDSEPLDNILPEYLEIEAVELRMWRSNSWGTTTQSGDYWRYDPIFRIGGVDRIGTRISDGPIPSWPGSHVYDDVQLWYATTNPATDEAWTREDIVTQLDGYGIRSISYPNVWGASTNHMVAMMYLNIHVRHREPTGEIHTILDLGIGGTGGKDVYFYFDDDRPSDSSIQYDIDGSNDQIGWTPLGTDVADGTVIDAEPNTYRYHKVKAYLATSTDAFWSPRMNSLTIEQEGSEGRFQDESGPSDPADIIITTDQNYVRILRPNSPDPYTSHWNVYRTDEDTGQYLFVAQVLYLETEYIDENGELQEAPTSFYWSDQGNYIEFAKPVEMQGISQGFHAGILFGWFDEDLFWCEPGYPDAWPAWYTMKMPYKVRDVLPMAGAVAVLTEGGPIRLDGTHPELLQFSQALGVEPAIGGATKTSKGIAYVSDGGVALFNMVDTNMITDDHFGERWWKNNVVSSTAFMADNDNRLMVFHEGGVLVRSNGQWTTLPTRYYSAYRDYQAGDMLALNQANIIRMHSDTSTTLPWRWKSGELAVKESGDRQYYAVEVSGSGTVAIYLWLDGAIVASKTASMDRIHDRRLMFPKQSYGRAVEVELVAEAGATIDELVLEYAQ